ncbi:MAG TPA: potassium-transporting ATPase subunit C [Thermoplasmata archaeon]|nr:potassium-transporting ATPase subunit C [Thermoplasmata archaeon]
MTRPAPPPPAHSGLQHLRATALFLVLALLVSGVAYPVVVTGIAELVDPAIANGSLLRDPNGTVVGSSLIAQNTSAPYLFWERPSLTDYNTTLGTDTPPGPSDPALGALLNETIAYMDQAWNFSANHTLPDWLVTPSGSDLDPDLVPQAVLIQVPRVAAATNESIAFVTQFVNAHITNPVIPFIGVAYVNVLELDIAWLKVIGK